MISFVWSSRYPFLAGAGGSENYTAGQVRELMRRGIDCRIVTIGFGKDDGREQFPDIEFMDLESADDLADLDDVIVFVTYPLAVETKYQPYVILHCPPMASGEDDPLFDYPAMAGKRILTPSKFSARLWAKKLKRSPLGMQAVYPFAEPVFGQVERPRHDDDKTRILFAGRLVADKGIYTLLSALHLNGLLEKDYELTATTAGAHTDDGRIIRAMLESHPKVTVVPAKRSPQAMAELMAQHDIVVVPSTNIFWKEAFGITSVEAQHAGCRVVASRAGGLPETDCGGLIAVTADNPQALSKGILRAVARGPLSEAERAKAINKFTVQQSVDQLLRVLNRQPRRVLPRVGLNRRLGELSPQLSLLQDQLKQPAASPRR
ncbi:glycosyl transferase family 1 [Candidatus Saccharibacteria bacterium]|nr:MAG: glycosyl transferase family 1 [Candidatus Saccharibacteria bacterium]